MKERVQWIGVSLGLFLFTLTAMLLIVRAAGIEAAKHPKPACGCRCK